MACWFQPGEHTTWRRRCYFPSSPFEQFRLRRKAVGCKLSEQKSILLRLEGFNLLNHGNFPGRGVTTYGDALTPAPTFGQFVGGVGTATNAIPAFANIDPPRMFQVQARFVVLSRKNFKPQRSTKSTKSSMNGFVL